MDRPSGELAQFLGGHGPHLAHLGRRGERHQPIEHDPLDRPTDFGLIGRSSGGVETGGQDPVDHQIEPGLARIEGPLLNQAGRPLRVEHELHDHVGRGRGGADGVEHQAGGPVEELSMRLVRHGTRRDLGQDRPREDQLRGLERREHRGESRELILGGHRLHRFDPVAAESVVVPLAADDLGGCLDLIAVVEIKGDQHLLERRHRGAAGNRAFPELVERRSADLHHPVEFLGDRDPVVPEMGLRMGAARRPSILVRQEREALGPGRRDQSSERRLFVGTRRKVLISELDRLLVPGPDALLVGLRQVDPAIGQFDVRVGVVHDRGAALAARDVVVLNPQRMADLVGGQLADPRQGHPFGLRGRFVTGEERGRQSLGNHEVLANPERA